MGDLSGVELIASCVFSGSSAAGRPSEDVDSRTIFVSNVIILIPLFLVGGMAGFGIGRICLISEVLYWFVSGSFCCYQGWSVSAF